MPRDIKTEFGAPTDTIVEGSIYGVSVAVISRLASMLCFGRDVDAMN